MEIDFKLFLLAGIITLAIFGLIYTSSQMLNAKRESVISELRDEVIDDLENIKAFTAISSLIGEEENCNLLQSQLKYFDKSIWSLGIKLDSYEQASRNIFNDPFYQQQKKRFIVNQVFYLSVLDKMKKTCKTNIPATLIYFYANSNDCDACDAQSFVLTDINKEVDDEIAIFSLDTDIEIIATQILIEYYNITEDKLPCVVVNGKASCGFFDKNQLSKELCRNSNLSTCTKSEA